MLSIRFAHKWLAFLAPLTLSLAVLGALGCSGNDDKKTVSPSSPPAASEVGIQSIKVNKGILYPPYSDDVRNYSVGPFYAEASDFSLTVTLKDARSRLTINGEEVQSGRAFPVSLAEGSNSIRITVEGTDGKISNIASLSAKVMHRSTKVFVYDSVAGNYLANAKISVRDARTNELLDSNIDFPLSAQGSVFLGLEKNRRYNVYAERDDTAIGCFADFDPSREDTVTLYCRKNPILDLPRSAPIIREIAFSVQIPLNFRPMPPGTNYYADTAANMYYLLVTVMAESSTIMTNNNGSVSVNIDDTPFTLADHMVSYDLSKIASAGFVTYNNTPVVFDGKQYFMTAAAFDLSAALSPGEHYLHIAVYDYANSRTDQKLYFNVTSEPQGADADISNPSQARWYTVMARTYGMPLSLYSEADSEAIMATDQAAPVGDTMYAQFELDFVEGYRGWELQRAASHDGPWKTVRKRNYATPSSAYYFNATDVSNDLERGTTYYYRFWIYNNISEYYTNILTIPFLPPFNVSLVSPDHGAISDTLYPTFSFRVSDTAVLDRKYADYGHFTLYIRNKIGAEILKARFEVDYRAIDAEGNPRITINWPYNGVWYYVYDFERDENGNPIMTRPLLDTAFAWIEDDGTFVIDSKRASKLFGDSFTIFDLEPGVAYEWNIFGNQASAGSNWSSTDTDSMYFTKLLQPVQMPGVTVPTAAAARSLASNPAEGSGATNGYFTLIMHQSAE
ncbi:MAG: hypothetical protein LBQ86_01230 [Holophagales bacterium]|jgi:hypothetical protein|nr:hypothetical protein [Holophagales bacterium]